jgi:hypothetical protein
VENFGWCFSAHTHSEPQSIALSSAALVTAAPAVQVMTIFSSLERAALFAMCKATNILRPSAPALVGLRPTCSPNRSTPSSLLSFENWQDRTAGGRVPPHGFGYTPDEEHAFL